MTAAAVEQDQAEVPEPTPRQKRLAEWLEAMAAADNLLRQVIADELAEDIPAFEQAQLKAVKVLGEAYAAVQGPEKDLAALDAEIASAETELATWQSQLEQGDVAARVEARRWAAEWEGELAVLRQKREFADGQLLPLRDAWRNAKVGLERATAALEGRKLNATPDWAYYAAGQHAASYGFRFGLSLQNALRDPGHYEHRAAVDHMLHLCQVSGFRTENYADELPSDAQQAKRFWDQVYADASPAAPVPTGRQVVDAVHAEMTIGAVNKQLDNSPVRIEDRRAARLVSAPPPRSYMQPPPRIRDSLAGW